MLNRIMSWLGLSRSTAANPSRWFVDWISGGADNESGVKINREVALTYAAFWRGVDLISKDIGALPLVIYERTKDGREEAEKLPLYYLLKTEPNELMSSMTLRQVVQADALIHGSGYAYIMRNGSTISEILHLSAQCTYPEQKKGPFHYETWVDGQLWSIDPADVIHIRGLSPDGINPYSLVNKASESLGLGLAARKYGARFFKNNARATTILQHPGKLSPEAALRLKEGWKKAYGGENQNGTAVLEEGMSANSMSVNNNDAQFNETRQLEIREVAAWLGIPPHKLGDNSRTAYASLEQENQRYLDECLNGWLCTWEMELYRKLFSYQEKRSYKYTIEFRRQALLRANTEERYRAYQIATGKPFMTSNEVRAIENMNKKDGGDELANPLNMGNAGGNPNDAIYKKTPKKSDPEPEDEPENDAPQKKKMKSANHALVVESCRRAIRRLVADTTKAAEKPEKFNDFLDLLQTRHLKPIIDVLKPVVESLRLAGPTAIEADEAAIEYLRDYHAGLLAFSGRCKPAEFASRTAFYLEDLERSGAESLANRLETGERP